MLIAATVRRMAYGYIKDKITKSESDVRYNEAYTRMLVDNTAREEAGIVRILNEDYP
jgi:hypothetical protein